MLRRCGLVVAALAFLVFARAAHAQVPWIPDGPNSPPPDAQAPVPFWQAYLPQFASAPNPQPYFFPPCPRQNQNFALNTCVTIPGIYLPTFSGTIAVTAAGTVCWSGSIGGVFSGSPSNNTVSGCGNGSFPITLTSGDTLSADLQNSAAMGTLTLTVNCGGTPVTSTTAVAFGTVSAACTP